MAAKKGKKPPPPKKLKTQDAAEKATIKTRTDCSTLVGTMGPTSAIWTANSAVSDSGKKLVDAGTALGSADQVAIAADAAALAAHTARDAAQVEWDTDYDVFSANVSKFAPTPNDVTGARARRPGPHLAPSSPSRSASRPCSTPRLASSTSTSSPRPRAQQRARRDPRPPPPIPNSWKRVKGSGLRRMLTGLPPGVYWVRASSVRADEESDPTTAASVTVK